MTDIEKDNERVRALASAVYHDLEIAARAEGYVRQIVERHGNHPAFAAYMREMHLDSRLAEFVSRPEATKA